jgi:hypothetical protein
MRDSKKHALQHQKGRNSRGHAKPALQGQEPSVDSGIG